jgi:phosphoribosylformylglycinamidine (FGAM) synthase-like enzyme
MKKTVFLAALIALFAGVISVHAMEDPFKKENEQLIKLYNQKNKSLEASKVAQFDKKIKELKFKKQRLLLKLLKPFQDKINAIEAKKIKLETEGKNTEKLGLEIEKIQEQVNFILDCYYLKDRE